MKNFLKNMVIALVSTAFAFFLFQNFYQPTPVILEKQVPVKLVNHPKEAEPNTKPQAREWSNSANFPQDFTSVSSIATASVVNITTLSATGYRVASGSGVIVSSDGYIITNHHVVEDGSSFEVALFDKRTVKAKVVGSDPTTDLALVKINERGLDPLEYGNSDDVKVGEWVLAVGNPFNLSSTVTAGIVSAKARNINILRGSYSIESFIQTDAVVNPGNSGGALVNTDGDLIGINTAIISESGGYEGYSFAIPSNLVRKVIRDLKEFGEVKRAILGVGIQDVDGDIASDLRLPTVLGIYINNVTRGSSAAEAGLRTGDVIIGINGVETNSVPELQEQVALFRPGDRISLEYYRDGRKFRMNDVRLKSLEESATSYR